MTTIKSGYKQYYYSNISDDLVEIVEHDSDTTLPDEVADFLNSISGTRTIVVFRTDEDRLSVIPTNTGSNILEASLVEEANAEYFITNYWDSFEIDDWSTGFEIEILRWDKGWVFPDPEVLEMLSSDLLSLEDYPVLDEDLLSSMENEKVEAYVHDTLIPEVADFLSEKIDYDEINEGKVETAFWNEFQSKGWYFEEVTSSNYPYFYGQNATEFEMWKEDLDPEDFRA